MKIALIGISGTGKSTLARKLGRMYGIEPLFTDSYIWEANWALRDKEIARQDMLAVLQKKTIGYLTAILPMSETMCSPTQIW